MSSTRLGPVGGPGGTPFGDHTVPKGAQLREIHIYANWCVDGIQLFYRHQDGSVDKLPKVGAAGGIHHVFFLADDEVLTGISGRCGWYIDSIQFHTNKRHSHAYGGAGGEDAFFLRAPEGEMIVGLFGREGWYVDALGVIVEGRPLTADGGRPTAASDQPSTTDEAEEPTTAMRSAVIDPGLSSSSGREPQPRDLQQVEGIGPQIAALLIEQGIYDLADLAQTSVERLREILAAAGRRYNIADPTTWPQQAALAAQNAWDTLKELQQTLKSGRHRS